MLLKKNHSITNYNVINKGKGQNKTYFIKKIV